MLDGLFTFFASHHAVRAEVTLRSAGLEALLIPGPKELSPNCGTAVRFAYDDRETALRILAERDVEVDEVHRYSPATDDWDSGTRAGLFRRRSR